MSEFNFEVPSRQSVKGIIVLWGIGIYQFIRKAYLFFFVVIFQWIKRPDKFYTYFSKIGLGIGVLLIYIMVRKVLDFYNFTYHIKDDNFILKEGILKKNTTVLPLDKIQNINTSQNILHRLLNIVQLSIDSAGSKGSEVEIAAISKDKAVALKTALGKSISKNLPKEQEVFQEAIKVSPITLLLVGITQNHLKSLVFVFAALVGVFSELEDVFDLFGAKEKFDDFTNVEKLSFVSFIILLLFTAIVSILYSIGAIFVKNFGLKAKLKGKKFDVEKGLFNKLHYALNVNKIQSLHLETNFLKDKFNLFNMVVKQAMSNHKSKKNVQLVGVREFELDKLKSLIYRDSPLMASEKIKPNIYYLIRNLLFTVLFVIVINVVLYFLVKFNLSYINIVVIPLFISLNILSYKKRWFSISDTHIISGSGNISTLTDIIETHKIQTISITQSFGQKRKSLANINIFVASTEIVLPCIDYKKAMKLYNYLLFKVESTSKNWN